MNNGTIKLQGYEEIRRKLSRMPEALSRRVAAASVRAGARIVLRAAKRNARRPGGSGTLSRAVVLARDRKSTIVSPMYSIYTRRGKSYRVGMRQGRSGTSRKANKTSMDGFYGPWVELGTRPHNILKSARVKAMAFGPVGRPIFARKVRHPGAKASPYLGPAFFNNQQAVFEEMRRFAAARIEKELEKA